MGKQNRPLEFVEKTWNDIERFKEQKDKDLREALVSYAIMQISMCKKGIQVWSNAKECFNKIEKLGAQTLPLFCFQCY
ncbi:intercellular trafficking and secretion [Ilyodon furcidens]|uniref:Intercellular trafficking and secretion n=1 Tax=Ilyodon furcidens TaxID=33524 RepID=A0ABV0SUE0_9TELE